MILPRDILDRVERVIEYHQASKLADGSLRDGVRPPDLPNQPSPYRLFDDRPKVAMPTSLLDVPVETLSVLHGGIQALPPQQARPPQDLKTLASWLYMAAGLTAKRPSPTGGVAWARSCPSEGDTYPCEIYVAAFSIDGLSPGLYHFSPREFSLRQLRGGVETLAALKRGRPDLEFLKTVPAALLVSTLFCRSSWRFGRRGYRHALLDAGRLVQNLSAAATGLGVQTLVRLRMNDATTRELIGLGPETEFAEAEAVQAMVVWADHAAHPLGPTPPGHAPLPPLARKRLAPEIKSYGSILAVHEDCVAPGVAIREVRPPLTEVAVLSKDFPAEMLLMPDPPRGGLPLRQVLTAAAGGAEFANETITRDELWTINRLAFRGGSYFPIFPDGPHVGLVRPFWVVRAVAGLNAGVWYYRPQSDEWSPLRPGAYRDEAQHLALDDNAYGDASATCVLLANIHRLLSLGGPDVYRLMLLESGIVTQRMALAAAGMGLGFAATGGFYDEAARSFVGVDKTGWEPLGMAAVGVRADVVTGRGEGEPKDRIALWRD